MLTILALKTHPPRAGISLWIFEIGSHSVEQARLKLFQVEFALMATLLPSSTTYWDERRQPPYIS